MTSAARFALIEDHPLVLQALQDNLQGTLEEVEIVYAGASVDDAIEVIERDGADCVILDLGLRDGRNPIANVTELKHTEVPILIVSALGDPATVRGAIMAGAAGYVSKQAPIADLIDAVRATLRGSTYMSSEIAAVLISAPEAIVRLSDQERQVMVLYASGLTMDAVAEKMGITTGTAREYIKRVRVKYAKAGSPASTKTDLYRIAINEGLITA